MLRPLVLSLVLLAACNDSKEYNPPGPVPQIQSATGPTGAVATCDLADGGGGNCPLEVKVTFRLAEGSFVTKAILTFAGDQDDDGVDHAYVLPPTYGLGPSTDVTVTIPALIPATILRSGALYTYSVRLLTGAGDTSLSTSLSVTVP